MREKWIDNAKGVAILLVIIGHCSGGLAGLWDLGFVYGIHLVMFWLLSGYTLKKKEVTREFVNQKFCRLMIPYFYTCMAITATDIFNSWYINRDCSIITFTNILGKDLLRSFFASGASTTFGTIDLGVRIGAIWFLPAMFFAVILFQFLLNYDPDDRYLGVYCGIIAFVGYLSARFIWLPFSIQSGMMACFFIWIGYQIKKQKILNGLKWHHYVIAQLILLLGIFGGYCDIAFVVAYIADIIISIPVGLAGCLLIYLFSKTGLMGNVLGYIGRNSLVILCTHLYALETIGVYFDHVLDEFSLSGNYKVWMVILLNIVFAVFTAFCIDMIKRWLIWIRERSQMGALNTNSRRDVAIDVSEGIFIIAMLFGHFDIDGMLRSIIYSCHMVAFVFLSGYFYKKDRSVWKSVRHMIYTFMIPYFLFVIGTILMDLQNVDHTNIREILTRYLIGISFSNKIFQDISSVGPIYFILLLFVVRFIYLLVDHGIKNEGYKLLVVVCISLFGMVLGKRGFWLPWSIDAACYALIFYQIGIYCRRYKLLSTVKEHHISYFILSPIWVYMIYVGSMEIAVRNYGQYGLVVLGSIAGILLIYKLSVYITDTLPVTKEVLRLSGEGSMVILIIHTLLGGKIYNLISYKFDSGYTCHMVCVVLLQMILSLVIMKVLHQIKYQMYHKR